MVQRQVDERAAAAGLELAARAVSAAENRRPLSAAAVIPARIGSTRLPGKPLLLAGARPLIAHVLERVRRARRISTVVVATDDERIADAARRFGGIAMMTSSAHATGSDRIGELLPRLSEDVIVNVQGDEPEIEPDLIDALVARLEADEGIAVATAAAPWPDGVDPADPNRVKVVVDARGRALYFSRAAIPASKAGERHAPGAGGWPRLHLGVYAYHRDALARFLSWPRGALEQRESLEQLRLLENGLAIGVVPAARAFAGIDTPDDFEAFLERLGGGKVAENESVRRGP